MTDPRRRIPSVDSLLEAPAFAPLVEREGRARVRRLVQEVQGALRDALAAEGDGRDGEPASPGAERGNVAQGATDDPAWYAAQVRERLDGRGPSLRRVINATGVVLHTNLGRAPLPETARRAVLEASGYGSLEYDLERGERGSRHDHCVELLRELTGAPAALVVNNNAAAVLLVLNTLAPGREAVISRGELVEIGGSFRVPEIMRRSGAVMREVGATNRTHPEDYRRAIGPRTALLLKVHRSNFRIEGFTAEVGVPALARVAVEAGLPLVHDLGSGALLDLRSLGLPPEPTPRDSLADGAGVVTLSGDKLLGGPQAGIIAGDAALLGRVRNNPLTRALRPDKMTLAALEATLDLYRDPERAVREVPVLRMLAATPDELERRAQGLVSGLSGVGVDAESVPSASAVGGGAYPGVELPSTAVALRPGRHSPGALAARLRAGDPPVVARVRDGRVQFDLRTVDVAEEAELVSAIAEALGGPASAGLAGAS